MTIPTRDKMRADLARAMGWTVTDACVLHPSPERCWFSSDGRFKHQDDPPDPFANADDSREMVKWLAQDDARWVKFYYALEDSLKVIVGDLTFERGRKVMTAPLPVIAEAAWRAIQAEAKCE